MAENSPGIRVLLVEPDAASRAEAERALAGFEVESFGSGAAALLRVAEAEFHVLVVADDLGASRAGEFMASAREKLRRPSALLILLAREETRSPSLAESEMVSDLAKPVDGPRLARMVEQLARLADMRLRLASVARPTSRGGNVARPASTGAEAARPITRPVDPKKS